jgi:hypothetical protein
MEHHKSLPDKGETLTVNDPRETALQHEAQTVRQEQPGSQGRAEGG